MKALKPAIKWKVYPKSLQPPLHFVEVVNKAFVANVSKISSTKFRYDSNTVLKIIKEDLEALGFQVETGKTSTQRIRVPVLFGEEGKVEKAFDADGWNRESKTVIEVEAGRGVTNYQFLKDLFQACVMQDIEYLIICVRNQYRISEDYKKVLAFFDSLYASNRLHLPLKGVMIIGY